MKERQILFSAAMVRAREKAEAVEQALRVVRGGRGET